MIVGSYLTKNHNGKHMKNGISFIFSIIISALPIVATAQEGQVVSESPFCQQLVGQGDRAVKLSIEVLDDESLRLTITRAYSASMQANPEFNFDSDWIRHFPTGKA